MADWLTLIVTIVCLVTSVFYICAKWKLSYWQRRGVKTLPTNIFFGNFTESAFFRVTPAILFGRLCSTMSDSKFFGIYILHKPFLIINDPKLIKQMFIKDFDVFSNRYFSFKNKRDLLGTHNLFSIDNPEWRILRQKLSAAFSTAKLKSLFGLIIESSESLKRHLEKQFEENPKAVRTIDVKDASSRYTTDIISSVAFGVCTDSFNKSTVEFYDRGQYVFKTDLLSAFLKYCRFFFPRVLDYCTFVTFLGPNTAYFRNVFWSSIRAREDAKSERGDVLDNLIKLKNESENTEMKFDGDLLVAQSVIFFAAGLETSSTTISFALLELAKHPAMQERLRKEILEKLEDGGLTYENVQKMKYLTQVINETLRLYPPAPIIDRATGRDYKIPDTNVIIEKGTPVYAILYGLHRNPEYFPNPDTFDPDRFSDESNIDPHTFMPFGIGPRLCIGMRLGLLQTAIGIIRMIQDYRVSVDSDYDVKINPGRVFIGPIGGVDLNFEKLNPE